VRCVSSQLRLLEYCTAFVAHSRRAFKENAQGFEGLDSFISPLLIFFNAFSFQRIFSNVR
jgi:hypothetical protein